MLVALVANAALAVVSTVPAAAVSACPPNPTTGPVRGPLDVTGTCVLTNVLVTGPVTVESGGALELEGATINGGVTVRPGGGLFAGHVVNTGIATYNRSVINGGVRITDAPDSDLDGVFVNGSVTINGVRAPFFLTICGSTISGSLTISRAGFVLGDPDGDGFVFENAVRCLGNTIRGSVTLSDVPPPSALFLQLLSEVESNRIGGSVTISRGRVALEGNTISRDVICGGGGSVTGDDEALSTNSISGRFAC